MPPQKKRTKQNKTERTPDRRFDRNISWLLKKSTNVIKLNQAANEFYLVPRLQFCKTKALVLRRK